MAKPRQTVGRFTNPKKPDPETPQPTIRERMEDERAAIATACDIDPTHVGHLLAGRRHPSVVLAKKLASYLGITVDELFLALGI